MPVAGSFETRPARVRSRIRGRDKSTAQGAWMFAVKKEDAGTPETRNRSGGGAKPWHEPREEYHGALCFSRKRWPASSVAGASQERDDCRCSARAPTRRPSQHLSCRQGRRSRRQRRTPAESSGRHARSIPRQHKDGSLRQRKADAVEQDNPKDGRVSPVFDERRDEFHHRQWPALHQL